MIGYRVEAEGRARDGLQLRVSLQPQEARDLAGLHEVEGVRPRGGGGPVALHALQLLGPGAAGHHVQLHVLRLLLVEQHLGGQSRACRSNQLRRDFYYVNGKLTALQETFRDLTSMPFFHLDFYFFPGFCKAL